MSARVMMVLTIGLTTSCAPAHQRPVSIVSLFGPAVGSDTITGRADDAGAVLLMVGGTSLVRIDLTTRQRSEVRLQTKPSEPFWGLARLADATLWTLNGQNTLTQIASDGNVVREVGAPNSYLGLFSGGDRLILQRTSLPVGAPAMITMIQEDSGGRPWGGMTVRGFERLASGAAAAMNLVSCGTSERAEMPCWFPEEPALSLIAGDGTTRRLVLEGLAQVAPEVLINAAAPLRPIRDVFIERDGTIWVLASGDPPTRGGNLPGGWLLARYGPQGQPIDRRVLPEPVRVILRAKSGRALVLTGAGMVAEVQP